MLRPKVIFECNVVHDHCFGAIWWYSVRNGVGGLRNLPRRVTSELEGSLVTNGLQYSWVLQGTVIFPCFQHPEGMLTPSNP